MTARNYRANFPIRLILLLPLIIIFSLSCGGGGNTASPNLQENPMGVAMTPPNERNALAPQDLGSHVIWGLYTMIIDQDTHEIEVVENRELAMHLNVKGILQSDWWCPAHNCIKIQFLNIDTDTNVYTIKGTLVNPSHFTGYDVRVIIFYGDTLQHDLLNPDDYTMLYEPDDDINPFRSYAKTVAKRQFKAFASYSEIFEMYIPPVPGKFKIDFAVDASYPGNCEEPYELEDFGFDGSIYPDDPGLDGIDQGLGSVFTEVEDWQENVSEVSVDTTPITGGITYLAYNDLLDRWEASITDAMDAPPGDYRCLIAAYSEDDPTLGLFNYVIITVDETPPPAVQTISGMVVDSFFMDWLDGSAVTVVNQDLMGFSPDPVTVTSGEYLVNVITGIYNITVVPDDITHHTQVVWDVAVTTNEDVEVDIGLSDPYQLDPYDPIGTYAGYRAIMGFAGRVVDDLGNGIPYATVELQSPDSYSLSSDPQWDVCYEQADENGYFSMLNVPVQAQDIDPFISQYRLHVRAPGFQETIISPLPAFVDQTFYNVIILSPEPVTSVVWEDSFETTPTDWSLSGYYHVQTYDASIMNISFSPAYNFVVIPPDEGPIVGNIPVPTDGANYLWYGVEQDGNFLGSWDPFQGPYTGGLSYSPHSGMATSPSIDLSGYTSARVEFDMCYDIESQQPASFDEMRFYVVQGGFDYFQQFYNPFTDPGPNYWPVSMAGWNRTVIWTHFSYDLTSYVGDSINLRYTFSTDDELYNGCRGQFIDNIKVYGQ